MMEHHQNDNSIDRKEASGRPRRRGIAMLLVIVVVAVVTVMATAYLSSREGAPEIGQNVIDSLQARVAADSGLAIAKSLIEDPALDIRAAHDAGSLVQDYNYGGGTLTITVADEEGNVPTATTETMRVVVTGTSNGLTQVAIANVHDPLPIDRVDIDLSEFAVFAHSSMVFDINAIIGRWSATPDRLFERSVQMGTNSIASGAVKVASGASVIDGTLWTQRIAPVNTLDDTSGSDNKIQIKHFTNSQPLPIPNAPTPTAIPYSDIPYYSDPSTVITAGYTTSHTDLLRRFTSLEIKNGAVVRTTYNGSSVILVDGNFSMDQSARWVIGGNLTLIVEGDIHMHGGSRIELADGARLRMFVGGTFCVRDGGRFGAPLSLTATIIDPTKGTDTYQPSSQCRVYDLTGSDTKGWKWDNSAILFGEYYAPAESVLLDHTSALFGRILGDAVTIKNASVLHYDGLLDEGLGYTNPYCLMYSADETLDAALLVKVTNLDESSLDSLDDSATAIRTAPEETIEWELVQTGLEPARDGAPSAAVIPGP